MNILPLNCVCVRFHEEQEWLLVWGEYGLSALMSRELEVVDGKFCNYEERTLSAFVESWFIHYDKVTPSTKKLLKDCPIAGRLGINGHITEGTVRIILGLDLLDMTNILWREGLTWYAKVEGQILGCSSKFVLQCLIVGNHYGLKVKGGYQPGDKCINKHEYFVRKD